MYFKRQYCKVISLQLIKIIGGRKDYNKKRDRIFGKNPYIFLSFIFQLIHIINIRKMH